MARGRWWPEEEADFSSLYRGYVGLEELAVRFRTSVNCLKVKACHLGLRRDVRITKALARCPDELKLQFGILPNEEWLQKYYAWREKSSFGPIVRKLPDAKNAECDQ